ncbi:4a-hydroxytetrahydrobiopterin dehydratase [Propionivibrio sp.]|uniref:4a-hydroxytetrahydrobiopterin dehydratase n=1 Tax=Propionivibrio sp. TaxID=2212460 RepID=UPI003BF456B8
MNTSVCDLTAKSCRPCEGGVPPLEPQEIERLLKDLSGWEQAGNELVKTFNFRNYYETMAFVNATAWISHRENHHPDLEVGYKQCRVRYSTHAIGGLSENDFICAAKIDALDASKNS